MEITLIDLLLVIIVGAFVLYGAFFGFIHTLGNLIGAILGIFVAGRIIDPVFNAIGFIFGGGIWGKIILFVILFLLITKLFGVLFYFVEKAWGVLSKIPFAKSINRLLGMAFGFMEGVIVVGIIIFYALQYLPEDGVRAALETSALSDYLLAIGKTAKILLPEAVQRAREATETIELPSVEVHIETN